MAFQCSDLRVAALGPGLTFLEAQTAASARRRPLHKATGALKYNETQHDIIAVHILAHVYDTETYAYPGSHAAVQITCRTDVEDFEVLPEVPMSNHKAQGGRLVQRYRTGCC